MKAFETLRAIRDLRGLTAAHKAILYAMVLRTDATGECWPSYPTLAADAGVSLALVKRAVKELERAEHITVRRSVDARGWSQVNRYVVHVRPDVGSTRSDGLSERDDVASLRDDVVHKQNGPRVAATRGVVQQRDDGVRGRHDGRVLATRGVVSQRDGGGVVATPDLPNEPPNGRSFALARSDQAIGSSEVVSQRHQVVYGRHDGRVMTARGVVPQRDGGSVVATPDLPNELPNGRSFALARSDQAIGPMKGRPRRAPTHPPELIAAKNAVVAEFVFCCETKKGTKPKKIHERDHSAAFALARTYGPDEGRAIVRRAFEDDFVVTKCTTIAFIESKAETYRGNATQKNGGRRELQALVGDEPWLKEHRT